MTKPTGRKAASSHLLWEMSRQEGSKSKGPGAGGNSQNLGQGVMGSYMKVSQHDSLTWRKPQMSPQAELTGSGAEAPASLGKGLW